MKSLDGVADALNPEQLYSDFGQLSQVSLQIAQNQRLFERSVAHYRGGSAAVPIKVARFLAPIVGIEYDVPQPQELVRIQQRLLGTYVGQLGHIIGVSKRELVQVQNKLTYTAQCAEKKLAESSRRRELLANQPTQITGLMNTAELQKRRELLDNMLSFGLLQHELKQMHNTVRNLWAFEQQLHGSIYNAQRLKVLGEQFEITIGEMSQSYVRMGLEHKNMGNITTGLFSARTLADTIAMQTSAAMNQIHSDTERLSYPRNTIGALSEGYTQRIAQSVLDLDEYVQTVVTPQMSDDAKSAI